MKMSAVIPIFSLILIGVMLLIVIQQWFYAFRFYGSKTFVNSLSILRLRLGQPFRYGSFPVFILLTIITIWFVASQPEIRLSSIIAITVYFLLFVKDAAPPIILFLGTSSKESKRLFSTITSKIWGCISLLRAAFGTATTNDGVRTKEKNWQKTVHELTRIVPMVVVDTRIMSAAVMYEAEWMLHPERLAKALFVIGDDGKHPIIDALRVSGSIHNETEVYKVKESDVITVLEHFCSNYSRHNNSFNPTAR